MAKTKAAKKARARPEKRAKPAPKKVAVKKPATRPVMTPVMTPAVPVPAVPAPPPVRDEMIAARDVARLTRYGERFGAKRIDVRTAMRGDAPPPGLPLQLPVTSGGIALFDPAVPKSWRVLDRPVGAGQFRVMLSIVRDDTPRERLAAVVLHVGRPPIARWTVAHYQGQKKPRSAEQLPRCTVTSGWIVVMDAAGGAPGVVAVPPSTTLAAVEIPLTDGRRALALPCGEGEFAAYWAVDAADKPICLVIDFDAFTQKEWKARPAT